MNEANNKKNFLQKAQNTALKVLKVSHSSTLQFKIVGYEFIPRNLPLLSFQMSAVALSERLVVQVQELLAGAHNDYYVVLDPRSSR